MSLVEGHSLWKGALACLKEGLGELVFKTQGLSIIKVSSFPFSNEHHYTLSWIITTTNWKDGSKIVSENTVFFSTLDRCPGDVPTPEITSRCES